MGLIQELFGTKIDIDRVQKSWLIIKVSYEICNLVFFNLGTMVVGVKQGEEFKLSCKLQ
jgi:hypothetical protein